MWSLNERAVRCGDEFEQNFVDACAVHVDDLEIKLIPSHMFALGRNVFGVFQNQSSKCGIVTRLI